jgi:hypothetical protein
MRQYPIWNNTTSNAYKNSDRSHGANDYTKTAVVVGTSSRNSFDFVSHETRVFTDPEGNKTFEFLIDGKVFKKATLRKGRKEIMFSPLHNGKTGKWGK